MVDDTNPYKYNIKLVDAATTTGDKNTVQMPRSDGKLYSFQGTVAGTGSVTATLNIYGSNDGTNWILLATITLSGTTSATDAIVFAAPYTSLKGNVGAITGTGATANLIMGQ